MLWLFLGLGLALADGYYLEATPVDARAEAADLLEQARALGLEPRVIRRYRHGSGWEFVVVVEGFDARAGAENAARRLAEQSGQGIAVYRLEGGAAAAPAQDIAAAPAPEASLPQADELLQRAARSLGGVQGGQARLEGAASLRVLYDRTVLTADATVRARHDWASQGDQQRVSIEVADGAPGVSSTVVHGPGGAWVQASGQVRDARPSDALEVLDTLSPMSRLAWPLQFAARLETAGPYRVARQEEVGGRTCWVLVAITPTADQPTRLWLDLEDGRPARVDFATDGGRVELTLSDWREPDTGVVVPHVVEVRRDGRLVERIEVAELTLRTELPHTLFVRPDGG